MILACPPSEKATEPIIPKRQRVNPNRCPLISDAEASAALGQPTRAEKTEDGGCSFRPLSGTGLTATLTLVNSVSDFYPTTTAPDAQMLGDIGDRAVWLSMSRVLYVVDGNRMVVVKMGSEKMKPSELISRATALARPVLSRG